MESAEHEIEFVVNLISEKYTHFVSKQTSCGNSDAYVIRADMECE